MENYPKIKSIRPLGGKRLLVIFHNNVQKIYDCSPLLKDDVFSPLIDDSLFKSVKVDHGGHGISWNDEMDLSESELWINGLPAGQDAQPGRQQPGGF